MSKGTTIKEALAQWEATNGEKAAAAEEIKLLCKIPSIEKMDASLSTLATCTKLSLSTNAIEKITNLNGLKNLKILSLGRNNIKSFSGLEPVGDTLVELWISYNLIEKMKGIGVLKKLQVLYMSNNQVKDWSEVQKLSELPCLAELNMVNNPIEERTAADGTWRPEIEKKLMKLKKLDGIPIVRQDEEDE